MISDKFNFFFKKIFSVVIYKININIDSIISIITRVVTAVSFYILTFFSSRYLVNDDFAKWSLFITFLNLLPLLNLGISTGLVNKLSFNNSTTNVNVTENEQIINASFKFQILLSFLFILILCSLTYFNFNNSMILFFRTNLWSIIILIISLPFNFFSSILFSYKQIKFSNYISIIQNFILLILSIFLFVTGDNLNMYILFYSITYTVLLILFFLISISKNRIKIYFTFKDLKYISLITSSSFTFWVMSFISNILSSAQIFFVSYLFGINSVPNYFLFQKIFSVINTFHLAYLSPFTVKFIGFATNNKWDSLILEINYLVRKFTFRLYFSLGLLIFLLHPFILYIWTGKDISDFKISITFFFIFFLTSVGNVYSVLLNALGHFRIQIFYAFISFFSFILFISLFKIYFGPLSIAIATIPASIIILYLMRQYTQKIIANKLIFI
jgi:O-antigen/teichoic acid export membrane protein